MEYKKIAPKLHVDKDGEIIGYAATWIRVADTYGDVIKRGAFANTIREIKQTGRVIPFMYNHDSSDMRNFIGSVVDLKEDDVGLWFKAVFDSTTWAQQARELAKSGRLSHFSFAYDVLDSGKVTLPDGSEANELRELYLHEVSLVMYPANRDTRVIDAKYSRFDSKTQRVLRRADELLKDQNGKIDVCNTKSRRITKDVPLYKAGNNVYSRTKKGYERV